jgi:glyoxylase-like metal-dependent hydrolase (beta-lactamase superfamily II)
MEIVRNLHWIKGLFSNIYLWIGEDGLTLVDAGQPGDAKRIIKYFDSAGFDVSDINSIVVTHADYDHAGAAAAIQERCGAPVYTGELSARLLVKGKSPDHLIRSVQFVLNTLFRYKPISASAIQVVYNGETVTEDGSWQLIATPGHSPDHQSFFSPKHGILFAGDALSTRGNRLRCSPKINTGDMKEARVSAKKLLRLTPAVIACGHGPPMYDFGADQLLLLAKKLNLP